MQIRLRERRRVQLLNDFLSVSWLEFFVLFRQFRLRREDWRAFRNKVFNVHHFATSISVFLQECGDRLSCLWRIGHLQFALSIFVLRIDDDQSAIAGRSCRACQANN